MTITYHSGERIQATQADFDGTPAVSGGWKELGRTSNSALPDVTGLADKRYLMFLNFQESNASRPVVSMRVNGDTGSNYARRGSANGLTDYTNTSQTSVMVGGQPQGDTTTVPYFTVGYIANLAGKEKLAICNNALSYQLGADTSEPLERRETVFKWSNTSDAVDQLSILTTAGGSFNTNGELIVLGWDEDDTHTTNFWTELASVNGSGATNLSSGTFTAKKYLWVQYYLEPSTTYNPIMRFNSDSGTNYAYRYSNNGGTDGTSGSSGENISLAGLNSSTPQFCNAFIINNASNEKLVMIHTVVQNTAGAGNAPERREIVNKWDNSSSQITEINIYPYSGSPTLSSNSFIKVWGSN